LEEESTRKKRTKHTKGKEKGVYRTSRGSAFSCEKLLIGGEKGICVQHQVRNVGEEGYAYQANFEGGKRSLVILKKIRGKRAHKGKTASWKEKSPERTMHVQLHELAQIMKARGRANKSS